MDKRFPVSKQRRGWWHACTSLGLVLFTAAFRRALQHDRNIDKRVIAASSTNGYTYKAFACDVKEDPLVIVYNRVPKTGSTYLYQGMEALSTTNNYSYIAPEPFYNHALILDAIFYALKEDQRTVLVGHFNFPEIVYADKIAYINVVREPLERCISQHNYMIHGDLTQDFRAKHVAKKGAVELDDCMERPNWWKCFGCKKDTLLSTFCGREDGACADLPPEDMLQRGWTNIHQNYYVGLTEDLDDFSKTLERLFPSYFQGLSQALPPEPVNKKEHVTVSTATKEKVRKNLPSGEFELYERIKQSYINLKEEMKQCDPRG
jgi:hypothetical protein